MFTFKGISTKEMRIIVEEPDNLIAKAPIKHEILNIEGRDDAIYYPLGRSPIEISLTLQLLDPSKVDQVLMWLDGEGELIYKDRKTKARIFSEVQPIRTSGIRLINIDVVRSPYWDIITDDYSKPWGVNLIPNGWNSFDPYGNEGRQTKAPLEVFEDGYMKNIVKNSRFKKGLDNWNIVNYDEYETKNGLSINSKTTYLLVGQNEVLFEPNNIYYLRFKVSITDKSIIRWYADRNMGRLVPYGTYKERLVSDRVIGEEGLEFKINFYDDNINSKDSVSKMNDFLIVNLTNAFGKGKEPTKEWCDGNLKYYSNWDDIQEEDKTVIAWDNMAVHTTHLENGLTRVQTWGGNHIVKLRAPVPKQEIRYTSKIYIKNQGEEFNIWTSNRKNDVNIKKGFDGLVIQRDVATNRPLFFEGSKLDFISSDPLIVEGDTPPTWDADEYPRIVNEGNAVAKPLIRLTKGTSSTCEFEVNRVYFKYHFNQDDEVVIDCEKMEASDKGQLRNRHLTIGYEFPKLDPGPNVIKTISGDAIIEFKRKDRWL